MNPDDFASPIYHTETLSYTRTTTYQLLVIQALFKPTVRSRAWPGMSKDIRKHVKECDACQRTKASNQPPVGELRPLPIPQRPWQSIGMDYLGPVPMSKGGNDMILIAVDRLTKMAHFILTTTKVTAKETAELFLRYIFQYHGLPDNIISDRDPKFTSHFWKSLHEILGIKLLMSTAEHPQTDGQSEATVKIIQKLIRPFAFQDQDWETLLPSLEFAYNDTQQSSTGQTPFYLNLLDRIYRRGYASRYVAIGTSSGIYSGLPLLNK